MKVIKKVLSIFMLFVFNMVSLSSLNVVVATGNTSPYDEMLRASIDSWNSSSISIITTDKVDGTGEDLFNNQVLSLIDYAIDVFIVLWIAIAFFWAYKIMFSDKEDAFKEWIRLIVYGILWVIIMVSAKFIASTLIANLGDNMVPDHNGNLRGIGLASDLYNNLMYPFIKVALYLVIWVLFIMMAIKVISFIISTDETAKKKAWWMILWCAIWILIVMGSKQMVEGIMWKEADVLKSDATWIDQQWNPILWFERIPIIAQVLNWVMWLATFVVLGLIIIQAYRMFAKPDDPKNRERLKKTLLYVIIWVLVIWASYVISNFLIVNNLPMDTATATA